MRASSRIVHGSTRAISRIHERRVLGPQRLSAHGSAGFHAAPRTRRTANYAIDADRITLDEPRPGL